MESKNEYYIIEKYNSETLLIIITSMAETKEYWNELVEDIKSFKMKDAIVVIDRLKTHGISDDRFACSVLNKYTLCPNSFSRPFLDEALVSICDLYWKCHPKELEVSALCDLSKKILL